MVANKVVEMSELTIGEMIEQVPEGQTQRFERSVDDPGEERFFRVWQNWDYPDRLEWMNSRSGVDAPWLGTRKKARISVSSLPAPDVHFRGTTRQIVDFYSTGSHAYFISDVLFRLINEMDPDSLESIDFELRAKDGTLPFHVVMPVRNLEVVDSRRTTVIIRDEPRRDRFSRTVEFPEGIAFNNEALRGVATFSDTDAPGWYWSEHLISEAKARGVRGLYAESVATYPAREVERL